ncbi:hypothetical protein ACVU7I_08555 [Patulibacter sp. S7RM1-6]
MSRSHRSAIPRSLAVATVGLAATAALAAPAAAAVPALTTVAQPLQPLPGLDLEADAPVTSAAGEGVVAWTTPRAGTTTGQCAGLTLWTLRDGVPAQVADVPGACRVDEMGLDVGTAASGAPVAAIRTLSGSEEYRPTVRIVDLRTGRVRTAPTKLHGAPLVDVAVDDGRVYVTTTPRGKRATSTLWRGTLRGTRIVGTRRLRSFPRGLQAAGLLADRGRIAVRTTGHPLPYSSFIAGYDLRFGTPRGAWTRTGESWATEGGYSPTLAAGFDRSGALVTVRPKEGQGRGKAYAQRVRPRHGDVRGQWVRLPDVGGPMQMTATAFDATTRRFVTVGPDASGATVLGYTAAAPK